MIKRGTLWRRGDRVRFPKRLALLSFSELDLTDPHSIYIYNLTDMHAIYARACVCVHARARVCVRVL